MHTTISAFPLLEVDWFEGETNPQRESEPEYRKEKTTPVRSWKRKKKRLDTKSFIHSSYVCSDDGDAIPALV